MEQFYFIYQNPKFMTKDFSLSLENILIYVKV